MNVTPVSSTAGGFISVRPANAAGLPTTSNVNFTVGAINPNAVLVELPVGGADDGKIEITFDAFGAAGPTTEVLVDVVGYTTDTRLKAIETSLATKANSADVYTKTQIDARPFDSLVGGGLVLSDGTLERSFGNVTVVRTGTGSYTVTPSGFSTQCNLTIQVTILNIFSNPTTGFASAGFQSSGGGTCSVSVSTTNSAGVATDQLFQFALYQGGAGVLPLTTSDAVTCRPDETQTC